MSGMTARARRRVVASIPVFALMAAGLATVGATGAAAAPDPITPPVISDSEYYMNYVAPRVDNPTVGDEEVVSGDAAKRSALIESTEGVDEKFAQGNPVAAKALAELEAEAVQTGKSPKQLKAEAHKDKKDKKPKKDKKHKYKEAESTQEAKLLTILVEFNDMANDDFTGEYVPTAFQSPDCMPGEVQNGPLHNNIPNPADYELDDNNTFW
ncbi:MAG: protease, partial [Actinomycetota bacterium]|nr:protease [Actinomycetota bacterium]